MTLTKPLFRILLLMFIAPLCFGLSAPLTLQEAESITIQKHLQSDIADSNITITDQLLKNDTKKSAKQDSGLTFGVQKILPDESYPITQNDNTIYKVGIQQKLPNSDVYFIKNRQAQAMNALANRKQKDHVLSLYREIRNLWLSLYFLSQAQQKIEDTKTSLLALEQHPGFGSDQKQHIASAIKPSLTALATKNAYMQSQINDLRLKLAVLVGKNNAQRPLPQGLPIWPAPPPVDKLQARILRHPKLQEDSAAIQAIRAGTTLVKAQNKSSIGIGASYGVRQNEFREGNPTPDAFSAEIKFNFSSKADQQPTQRLRSHIAELEAAQLKQERDFRELTADLKKNYQDWTNFSQQAAALKPQLPEVANKTKAHLNAYIKNPHTGIKAVVEAYNSELQFTLKTLTAQVDAAKARANLLYYE